MADSENSNLVEVVQPATPAAPAAAPARPAMSLDVAFANVTAVVRAFNANADQHEILAQSLATIRDGLLRNQN